MTSNTEGEMVERVAEAIWSAHSGASDFHEDTYHHDEKERDWWRAVAKEAIKAMRSPTNSMLESGLEALKQNQGELAAIVRDADACYRAMLHEALK